MEDKTILNINLKNYYYENKNEFKLFCSLQDRF